MFIPAKSCVRLTQRNAPESRLVEWLFKVRITSRQSFIGAITFSSPSLSLSPFLATSYKIWWSLQEKKRKSRTNAGASWCNQKLHWSGEAKNQEVSSNLEEDPRRLAATSSSKLDYLVAIVEETGVIHTAECDLRVDHIAHRCGTSHPDELATKINDGN